MDGTERKPLVDLASIAKNPPLPRVPKQISIKGKHGQVIFLDPRRVRPLPNNPRGRNNKGLSPERLRALAQGIRTVGQQTPAKVCISTTPGFDAQLIDGECRLLACKLGEVMLACQIDEEVDDTQTELLYIKAVVSNFQREDHNCVEKAEACRNMLDMGMSATEVAKAVGYSEQWVYQHLSLLQLHSSVQAMLVAPAEDHQKKGTGKKKSTKLSFIIGIMLVGLQEEEQIATAETIVSKGMSDVEARRFILNVRREKGIETPTGRKRKTRNSEKFDSLKQLIVRSLNTFGVYLDMHPQEIAAMASSKDILDREALSKSIHELTGCLNDIADRIEGKKPQRRK